MKIFAEPSEFQLPIVESSSSMRQQQQQQQHGGSSLTQNLLGMETPPTPLLDCSDTGGDLDTNYATILNYSTHNNNSSRSNNNSSNSALVNNSRSTNNAINLIDADYQTLRNTQPRIPPVSVRYLP